MKGSKYTIMHYYAMTVLLEYKIVHYNFLQMLNITINTYFTLRSYADIMLNAFNDPLCSKLCWHNRWVPTPCLPACHKTH